VAARQAATAWLTMAVQLGFVAGALLVALFNVADIWSPRVVVCVGALVGAGANALIPLTAATAWRRRCRSALSRGWPSPRFIRWG